MGVKIMKIALTAFARFARNTVIELGIFKQFCIYQTFSDTRIIANKTCKRLDQLKQAKRCVSKNNRVYQAFCLIECSIGWKKKSGCGECRKSDQQLRKSRLRSSLLLCSKAAAEILTMSCLLLNKGSRRIVFLTLLQPSDKLIGLGSSSFLSPCSTKPYLTHSKA